MFSIIDSFKPRLYQEVILDSASKSNSLVVLPTGLGKTAIAALLAIYRLNQYKNSKVLFLAPTKPLVQQHLDTFKSLFNPLKDGSFEDFCVMFTGQIKPEKRALLWESAKIIFSTPQGLENDLLSQRISLKDVSLVVFDEAHRATGDYSYTYIAKVYSESANHERILALTASPGSNEEKIREVCLALSIENIEVRSQNDSDVKEYVNEVDVSWVSVALSDDLLSVQKVLNDCFRSKLVEASSLGVMKGNVDNYSKSSLIALQGALMSQSAQGENHYDVLKTVSLVAESLKVQHALELCESQTIFSLSNYLSQLQSQAVSSSTRAVKNLVKDSFFRRACSLVENLLSRGVEHPKITRLLSLITECLIEKSDSKLIVFTQFRDTAQVIKSRLSEVASCEIFVGQAKKRGLGLSQKEQKLMLDRFRKGDFQVLIATSVAEEGLDIPSVDSVIFYEPVPSAIRTVQRRGRTGRHSKGVVKVLMASGTRDEAYRWSAYHKEKRMYRAIKKIQKDFVFGSSHPSNSAALHSSSASSQRSISSFSSSSSVVASLPTVIADHREKGSPVLKSLVKLGVPLQLKQLSVGDYQLSDNCVVEYKTVRDFVDSIIDGRLLSQLRSLRAVFKPIILLEGSEDLFSQRNINPASIRGIISAITLNYQIPIIRTSSPVDSASMLVSLAKRLLRSNDSTYQSHSSKPHSVSFQQEYVVSCLPGIGVKLAKPLLKHFGSVKGVFDASVDDLKKVDLIGEKKASAIRKILDSVYSGK